MAFGVDHVSKAWYFLYWHETAGNYCQNIGITIITAGQDAKCGHHVPSLRLLSLLPWYSANAKAVTTHAHQGYDLPPRCLPPFASRRRYSSSYPKQKRRRSRSATIPAPYVAGSPLANPRDSDFNPSYHISPRAYQTAHLLLFSGLFYVRHQYAGRCSITSSPLPSSFIAL